ncbi:MAG: hypothetical protein PVG53_13215 [Holophagae bacterium]
MATSAEIRIENVWGSVQLRAGDGDEVVVTAAGQRHRDDPRAPEVRVEESPSGLTIRTLLGDLADGEEPTEWRGRRIDIGVFVPETANVWIRTGDGDIEARDLIGRADLETESGDITFRGFGELEARTGSGSVFAQFRRSEWSRPVVIETRTGDIRAELLEGASVTAEVETRGPITTDFSIAIERRPGSSLKRGVATIGAGARALRLTSYSGAVRLVAVIVPEEKVEPPT